MLTKYEEHGRTLLITVHPITTRASRSHRPLAFTQGFWRWTPKGAYRKDSGYSTEKEVKSGGRIGLSVLSSRWVESLAVLLRHF